MDVDISVLFDESTVSYMNVSRPVDHHSRFDVDIFPVGAKEKMVSYIGNGYRNDFFLVFKCLLLNLSAERYVSSLSKFS